MCRGAVNSFTLDSIAWRPSDQFEFLREEFAPVSGMLVERREPTRSPFEFRIQRYSVPSIALERVTFGNPLQVRVTEKSMAAAMSDRLSLHYRTAGTDAAAVFGDNTSIAGPQDLRIIDFRQPFYSDLSRFESLNLVLNRSDVLDELPFIREKSGDIIRNSPLSNTLRQLIPCIFKELISAPDTEAAQMLNHLHRITIDTLRFYTIRDLDSAEIQDQSRLGIVLNYIERNYKEKDLTPEVLATATGMSRATLYRLCRGVGSPHQLVQKTRLRKAAELIRSGEGTNIEALSHGVGFSGRQSFTRAFQREFELSPKEYRQEYSSYPRNASDQGNEPYQESETRRTSAGCVNNRASCIWLSVMQANTCKENQVDSKPDVGRGIGIL